MADEEVKNDATPESQTSPTTSSLPPANPAASGQTFWLLKILDDIKLNPLNHVVLIGSTLSILIGLCAWQYCRGYFKALGINISYAHIDNLIFTFEQISRISLIKSSSSNVTLPTYLLLGGSIIVLIVSVVRKYWDKIKHHLISRSDEQLTNDIEYQYWGTILSFYIVFISASYILNLSSVSLLSSLLIWCSIALSIVFFIYEIWTKSPNKNSHRPILWLVYFLLPFNLFYQIGKSDGEIIIKNEYRTLDTICLSKPAQEFETESKSGFSICGKLVYSDSQQLCIKERLATNTHCRQKDKYEVTIISNIP